jgi:hypothetical protein
VAGRGQPTWMRAVLRAERTVGEPLTRAANSREGAAVLMVAARASRLARDTVHGARARVVHTLSLPSHRDVQLLDAKVDHLRRTVEELSAAQREHERDREDGS